ncbi:hypothetical protein EUGRSUZ_E02638 [Eucalyptus grandis]|uniref:Uncharacterized protein n=1 Tax=Eucalyptus grandis TaxID=71139 RepID=A0ACC3KYD2_EUCGR|nr:hypothetical protein EUGRSUZ_E02638 [Eucalyptus grandis]
MHHLGHSDETKEMFQAQSHLYSLTSIFVSSMSLKCAVQLGIPDVINDHKRPITLLELASALRIHPSKTTCLHRLMRVLVHLHIFAETLAPKHEGGGEEVAYLMLHAWSDEDCVKVLRKCRESIVGKNNEQGKVIIIDIVIGETQDDDAEATSTKLFFDMLMMTVVTGRERTEKEWEHLFSKAGFSQHKITPMFGLRSLIEVFP